MIATIFTLGGIALVRSDRIAGDQVTAGLPTWLADLALPIGFGLIALRLVWRASPLWSGRAIALLGIVAGVVLNEHRGFMENQSIVPWFAMVIFAGVLGAPIFALLGGFALFASLIRGNPPVVLPMMAYQELTTSTGIAAIPLFTLAGFLLAEGRSSQRLLRVFRAWVGWAPGGTAVAAATLCAFFTLFTGGSGVTILVLGGLLLPALDRRRLSRALLDWPADRVRVARLALSVVAAADALRHRLAEGVDRGSLHRRAAAGPADAGAAGDARCTRRPADARGAHGRSRRARRSRRRGKPSGNCSCRSSSSARSSAGVATLVESAPLAALYTLIVQRYIHRDLPTWNDVLRVAADCVALVGGVLLILAVAAGLTDYLVYAEIPTRLVEWTQTHIHSRLVFLLLLNVFLLLVGTLMDIFSAIVVVVPLIIPLAEVYGVDYVHLGIIFVANLELGFLHPPLGLNLLLASVRFKKPVLEVTWATLPMLGILAVGVLLITYVPWLTLGLLHWLGRGG